MKYDAVVVGAGPAGSFAALNLARAGARVLLLEKKKHIGRPVQCAGYAPAQITGFVSLPPAVVAQEISSLRTSVTGAEDQWVRAPGYMLHRDLFDQSLAEAAVKAGAELRMESRVTELDGETVRMEGRGGRESRQASVIIGADGPRSVVGRMLGAVNRILAVSYQEERPLFEARDHTEVFFDRHFPEGYGWLFPRGATANIGVGIAPGKEINLREAFQHLREKVGKTVGDEVITRTGGLIPVGGPVSDTVSGNVLLVGDAAGFTHPLTGAGILQALWSARLAARSILRALDGPGPEGLALYQRFWREEFGEILLWANRRREERDRAWDREDFPSLIRRSWVTFPEYHRGRERLPAGEVH